MSRKNMGEKIFSTHCDLAGKASNTLPYIFILRTVSNFDQKKNPPLIYFKQSKYIFILILRNS